MFMLQKIISLVFGQCELTDSIQIMRRCTQPWAAYSNRAL